MFKWLISFFSRVFLFGGYFDNGSYPRPLSAAEEKRCLENMQKGDAAAREKLICHNMRLVAHVAKKYAQQGDFDDFVSIGSIGLVKGVESFSAAKGTTLATYLARCIENEILMSLRSEKRYKNTVRLGDGIGVDDGGNEYSLMDVLQSDENVFESVEQSILKNTLLRLIRTSLDEREQKILLLRFGLTGEAPLTQLQTAEKLNISRSYVSRIETRALKKIRAQMSRDDL